MITRIIQAPVLTEEQCKNIWKNIEKDYADYLRQYGVYHITYGTAASYQLICLKYVQGSFIHKDAVSDFVKEHCPSAGNDQQVRHLNTQKGWYVTNKGQEVNGEKTPSGYHMLVSTTIPSPTFVLSSRKRSSILNADDFASLKQAYGYTCPCCGVSEGEVDPRTGRVVKLQQGHMDHRKELTLDNTIPQCEYCNQYSLNNFIYDKNGKIVCLSNAKWILNHITPEADEELRKHYS